MPFPCNQVLDEQSVACRALIESERRYCDIMGARVEDCCIPPYVQPPPEARRFAPRAKLDIQAIADGADHLVLTYQVPLGYDGILIQVVNEFNSSGFVEGSGDITWRIMQGRRYIQDYDAITMTLGNLTVPYALEGNGIRLVSGQLLRYFVNIPAAALARLDPAGSVICSFGGWIYPRR